MSQNDDSLDEDGGGFDVDDWARLTPFTGGVATLNDVQAGKAVFALGDTEEARVITAPAGHLVGGRRRAGGGDRSGRGPRRA
ncbi:hypothetical protein [Brevundimonas diminuta]|uniref:hypothetical protein n=1 Tax=Brevundimonas diminuta TaxID=293 RepID=UPI003D054480